MTGYLLNMIMDETNPIPWMSEPLSNPATSHGVAGIEPAAPTLMQATSPDEPAAPTLMQATLPQATLPARIEPVAPILMQATLPATNAPTSMQATTPVHSEVTVTEHDTERCEVQLHHIFQTARFGKVSTEVANSAISIYLDTIKKCSTVFQMCSCKVLEVWVNMEGIFQINKLQLFLMIWDGTNPKILLGNFKTQEELAVTLRVLYHCSNTFLKKMNLPPETPVVDFGVPSIEVANLPFNNSVVPTAIAVPKPGEFYQCCPLVKCCDNDLESCTATECENCSEVKHTHCALLTKHLRLEKHREIGDITCYVCDCGFKNWKIVGDIFYRVKKLIEDVGKVKILENGERKCIDAQNASYELVGKLKEVVNSLFNIMRITKPMGFVSMFGKNPIMIITFVNVLKMVDDLDKNQVDFKSWITMIDDSLKLFDTIEMY